MDPRCLNRICIVRTFRRQDDERRRDADDRNQKYSQIEPGYQLFSSLTFFHTVFLIRSCPRRIPFSARCGGCGTGGAGAGAGAGGSGGGGGDGDAAVAKMRAKAARDRKSTRLNSSHPLKSRMPSSA